MTNIVDASAVVDILIGAPSAGPLLDHLDAGIDGVSLTVAHLDAEVFSAISRLVRHGALPQEAVPTLLDALIALPIERLPIAADLLQASWGMRDNISAGDALYVAAARAADATLITTDARLARAAPDVTTVF